jgi:hypothetical protein
MMGETTRPWLPNPTSRPEAAKKLAGVHLKGGLPPSLLSPPRTLVPGDYGCYVVVLLRPVIAP